MSYSALPIVVTGTPIATTWGNQIKADMDETGPAKVTTAGDLLVGSGAGALARLAAVAAGQVLKSNGVGASPAYGQVTPSEVAAGTYAISISGQAATAASASGVGTLAQHLLFVDNTYDIGASGATRPRTVYLTTALILGSSPASLGSVRLPNTGAVYARNAANTNDVALAYLDGSNILNIGGGGLAAVAINDANGAQMLRVNTSGVFSGLDNNRDLGSAIERWRDVYCARGAFNGSSRSMKRDITPIDPSVALAAVRATEVVAFRYAPTDDADAGADRWHVGYVAEDAPDVLSPDHATVTPQTTASVALAAIQALAAEVADLKAQLAAALATQRPAPAGEGA